MPLCRHLISHPVVLVQDLYGAGLRPWVVLPEGRAPTLDQGGRAHWEIPQAPVIHHDLGLTLVLVVLSFRWIHLFPTVDVLLGASLSWRALYSCIIG